MQVLHDYQKFIAQLRPLVPLLQIEANRLPLRDLPFLHRFEHHVGSAPHLHHYLHLHPLLSLLQLDLRRVVEADPHQFQPLLVDEVFIGDVVDQIFEQGVLVLVVDALGFEVDGQLFVDVVDGLADVLHSQCAGDEEETGEEGGAAHLSLLAVDVHPVFWVLQCGLYVGDGLNKLVEGEIAVELEVEVVQFAVGTVEEEQGGEVVLVGVLADVPNGEGRASDVFGQLGCVAALGEVDVEEGGDDFSDGEGRADAVLQLVVVARQSGHQLRGVEALQHGIEGKHRYYIILGGDVWGGNCDRKGSVKVLKAQIYDYLELLQINKQKMKYYFSKLGKIFACYLVLVLLVEACSSAYTEYQISLFLMTPFDWKGAVVNAMGSIGRKLLSLSVYDWKLLGLTAWVVKEKVYYPVLVITALAVYYKLKEDGIEKPDIQNMPRRKLDKFHKDNEELTHNSVLELIKSKEYQQYLKDQERRVRQRYESPCDKQANQFFEFVKSQVFD